MVGVGVGVVLGGRFSTPGGGAFVAESRQRGGFPSAADGLARLASLAARLAPLEDGLAARGLAQVKRGFARRLARADVDGGGLAWRPAQGHGDAVRLGHGQGGLTRLAVRGGGRPAQGAMGADGGAGRDVAGRHGGRGQGEGEAEDLLGEGGSRGREGESVSVTGPGRKGSTAIERFFKQGGES